MKNSSLLYPISLAKKKKGSNIAHESFIIFDMHLHMANFIWILKWYFTRTSNFLFLNY